MTQIPISFIFINVLFFNIQSQINLNFAHHCFANLYGHFPKYFIYNHVIQIVLLKVIIKMIQNETQLQEIHSDPINFLLNPYE